MRKLIFIAVFASAVFAEPPPEALEGPLHYPDSIQIVRDILVADNQPGEGSSSGQYGVPGAGGPGSFGARKEVILADPELAPLLFTADLSPSVEKRTNGPMTDASPGSGFPSGSLPGRFGVGRGLGSGSGYN